VVIAHLISRQSYPRDDDIVTWNKFTIDEVLSEATELPCPGCAPQDPPSSLLPLQAGEFLIPKTGGTVNIDGIEVEQIDAAFPAYEPNQKYLLLINLYHQGLRRLLAGLLGYLKFFKTIKSYPYARASTGFGKISKKSTATH
jgi:hypothetical protein